jgi:hypothetical protein
LGGLIAASAALAAALAGAYLLWAPASQDLAAATFRAELFERDGFALWNNHWYSGHHLLSYSVLYPPLGALVGVREAGAVAVVAAAGLFAALAAGRGAGARIASLWFAAGAASWLLTGRMPFLLGVPFGLGALLAAERDRRPLAAALAALASLASPVSGLFTGLAGVALALAGERARGAWIALGAGVPILVLNAAFPVGGEEPFVFSAFIAIPLLAAAALLLLAPESRALRIGAVLYGLLALAVFVIPNPLGGNVTRLGALLAGPIAALVLWPRSRWVALAVCAPLLYWQLVAPVRDYAKAEGDRASEESFYEPLVAELERRTAGEVPVRIHVPPTLNRWEAAYVAEELPLARGWLRQLEHEDFDLFTDGSLDAPAYRGWLADHGVGLVALPDAERDYLAEDEAELIESGLPYLRAVWESEDWRLYRVNGARGGLAGAGVTAIGPARIELAPERTGVRALPVNWTRLWRVAEGSACVRESETGRIELDVAEPGPVAIEAGLTGDSCPG